MVEGLRRWRKRKRMPGKVGRLWVKEDTKEGKVYERRKMGK